MLRHPLGHWCGYAAVDRDHPLYGVGYPAVDQSYDIDVHGGLTYSNRCDGEICHVPKPGQSDNVWWFGFDCAHCWDISPGVQSLLPEQKASAETAIHQTRYRDASYVRRQVEKLASQLAALPAELALGKRP